MTAQGYETRDDDKNQDDDLDNAKEILQAKTPFEGSSMEYHGESNASEPNETQGPTSRLPIGRSENVFAKNKRIASGPS